MASFCKKKANLYPCPGAENERHELLAQVKDRLADVENVLAKTRIHRRTLLSGLFSLYFLGRKKKKEANQFSVFLSLLYRNQNEFGRMERTSHQGKINLPYYESLQL